MTNTRLTGRVAQVINDQELVINIGSEAGVEPGMKFAVLAAKPLEIFDPETNALLDVVDREKLQVEARTVRPKVTICKTFRFSYVGGGILGSSLFDLYGPRRKEPETFRAGNRPQPLSEEESLIKIGDRVVSIGKPIRESSEVTEVRDDRQFDPNAPTSEDLEQYEGLIESLVSRGVIAREEELSKDLAYAVVDKQGWSIRSQSSDQGWEAEINAQYFPHGTISSISTGYWSELAAIAAALVMALEGDENYEQRGLKRTQ